MLQYAIVSVPIILYDHQWHLGAFAPGHPGAPDPWLQGAWSLLTAAHMPAPMWFIPTIGLLYLGAPLWRAIDRSPRWYWLLPPMLVMAMLCHRPHPVNAIGQELLYFTPAYLLGMWFSRYRAALMPAVDRHLGTLFATFVGLEVLSVVVLGRSGAVFSKHPFAFEDGILDLCLPSKLVLSVALIGLLARAPTWGARPLGFLADASFGIFFLHEYVIMVTQRLLSRLGCHGIPGSFGTMVLALGYATLAAGALVVLVRRMLGDRSRYVVGC